MAVEGIAERRREDNQKDGRDEESRHALRAHALARHD